MKIKVNQVNDLPIMCVLKEKFGAEWIWTTDVAEKDVEVFEILRYINRRLLFTSSSYRGVNGLSKDTPTDDELEAIQTRMIERIKKLEL